MVPEDGLEPSWFAPMDFESIASTNSTTRATLKYSTIPFLIMQALKYNNAMTITIPNAVQALLDLLNENNYLAYLVGGCLRDALLGIELHDYDITTDATPTQMKEIFKNEKWFATGEKHGTLTILKDNLPIEITTFRSEGDYSDHRHPDKVTFVRNLKEDLSRRDFTINALAYNPREGLIDLFNGQKDLEDHLIRCIGKPEERFQEDALRILRGLRFSAQLGFTIEQETKQAMLDLKGLLKYLSIERIREEIFRLLVGKQAQRVILEEEEILKVVLPEVNFKQKTELDKLPKEALLRFAYLIEELPKETVRRITYRFKLSNEQRDSLHDITDLFKESLPRNKYELKVWLRGTSEKNVQGVFLLKGLNTSISKVEELYHEIMNNKEIYRLKDLAVDGKDLLKLGYEGPQIGEELNKILEAVMREKLNNDKKSIYQFLGKEPSC